MFVEKVGFEPTTLCLQSRCSSQTELQPQYLFVRTTGLEPILRGPKPLVLPITPCPIIESLPCFTTFRLLNHKNIYC